MAEPEKMRQWINNFAAMGWLEPMQPGDLETGGSFRLKWTPYGEDATAELAKLFKQIQAKIPYPLQAGDLDWINTLAGLADLLRNPQ